MDGYDVDFSSIFRYELHDREFGELTNLPCMIQRIYDKEGVLELLGINERVAATVTAQIRKLKGLTYLVNSRRSR